MGNSGVSKAQELMQRIFMQADSCLAAAVASAVSLCGWDRCMWVRHPDSFGVGEGRDASYIIS